MPNQHNILHLDINGKAVERIPILNSKDVGRMKEGLIQAYELYNEPTAEIYFYKESSMNKKGPVYENSKSNYINRN